MTSHSKRTSRTALEIVGYPGKAHPALQHPVPFSVYHPVREDYVPETTVKPVFAINERRAVARLLRQLPPPPHIKPELQTPQMEAQRKQAAAMLGDVFNQLEMELPDKVRELAFAEERKKAEFVLQHGVFPPGAEADLNEPERQLIWSGTLGVAWANGQLGEEFAEAEPVKQVLKSAYLTSMKGDFCCHLRNRGRGNAKLTFGAPGSWFSQRDDTGEVNLDLCFSLCMGGDAIPLTLDGSLFRCHGHFESIFYHEAGHARLSRFYPSSMTDRWNLMRELAEKGGMELPERPSDDLEAEPEKEYTPGQGISFEEYKEYERLMREYQLIQHAWNAAEDNVVNVYMRSLSHIRNLSQRHPSQLDDSFNVAATIVHPIGEQVLRHVQGKAPEDKPPEAEMDVLRQCIDNASRAINLQFYIDNAYLPDTPEAWQALGVAFEAIRENLSDTDKANMQAGDVKDDIKLIARAIQAAQPDVDITHAQLTQLNPKREKKIREYAAKLGIEEMPEAPSGRITLKEQVNYYCRVRNQFIQRFLDRYIEPVMKKLEPLLQAQVEEDLEMAAQEGVSGSGACVHVTDLPDNMEGLRGEGGVRASDLPGGTPQNEGQGQGQGGKAKDAKNEPDDTPGEQGESISDIAHQHEQQKNKATGSRGTHPHDRGERPPERMRFPPTAGSGMGASPFSGLALGDGRHYAELREDPAFLSAASQIAERLIRATHKIQQADTRLDSERHHFKPPLGVGYGRAYDPQRDLRRQQMEALGEPMRVRDYATIRQNEEYVRPTEGDLVILVDGSGSMGAGKGSYMELAMKSAALMKLGADQAKYRTYILLWGDDQPVFVTWPGISEDQENHNIDAIIRGKNCGTWLAPAFPAVLKEMAKAPLEIGPNGMPCRHGYSHFVVMSDGYTFADDKFDSCMATMMEEMPNATVDAMITAPNAHDRPLATTLAEHCATDRPPVIKYINEAKDVPEEMLSLVQERVEKCLPGRAMEHAQHIKRVERALSRILEDNQNLNMPYLHVGNIQLQTNTKEEEKEIS